VRERTRAAPVVAAAVTRDVQPQQAPTPLPHLLLANLMVAAQPPAVVDMDQVHRMYHRQEAAAVGVRRADILSAARLSAPLHAIHRLPPPQHQEVDMYPVEQEVGAVDTLLAQEQRILPLLRSDPLLDPPPHHGMHLHLRRMRLRVVGRRLRLRRMIGIINGSSPTPNAITRKVRPISCLFIY
jgi:hypothetical protein